MRRLTLIVLTVAALYSGYWFVGASTVEGGARDAIEQMRAEGWDVEYSGLNTAGFPNRFDTTVTDVRLAAPDGSLTWEAAFLQVFALSYRPNQIIAVLPDAQQVTFQGQRFNITSNALRASAAVKANTALALRDITVSSGPFTLLSDQGWQISAASLLAALRDASEETAHYDSYVELTDVAPPFDAGELTNGVLPAEVARLRFDARVITTKPLDRFAGEGMPVAVTGATLRDISIIWGDIQIGLAGDLSFNAAAEPTGTVTLSITDWPTLITAATNAGLLDEQAAQSYAMMARNAAAGSDDLSVPIALADGQASMGFIPLGYVSLGQP